MDYTSKQNIAVQDRNS